ncbi:hypothetical protein M3J09_000729 [Ascochyta lentis]
MLVELQSPQCSAESCLASTQVSRLIVDVVLVLHAPLLALFRFNIHPFVSFLTSTPKSWYALSMESPQCALC